MRPLSLLCRSGLTFLPLLAFSFFAPKAVQAAYDCAYNVTISGLTTCCYPESAEPLEGISCRPEGEFLQKIGTSAPICKTSTDLLGRASAAAAKNFAGFNCFTDQLNRACQDPAKQCYNPSTDACQTFAGPNPACESGNRITNCDQSCGDCESGYISCSGQCVAPQVGVCGPGYEFNQCTGTCSCPVGKTPSGIFKNTCVTYLERFAEILDFGLAVLGGPAKNGVYDYSTTGALDYLRNVYLKADAAETVDWKSATLPVAIKKQVSNYYRTCSTASDCQSGEKCSEGGLCNTVGATSGACVDSSDCALGYYCGANRQCSLPNAGLGLSSFVGLTSSAYNGDQNGYASVNSKCSSQYADSHVCTSTEVINSYIFNASSLTGVTDIAWVNAASPANITPAVNDCKGWENNANSPYYGTVWNFNLKTAGLQPCGATKKFACCK